MNTRPPRIIGFIIGFLFILILAAMIGWSIFQLSKGELSILLAVWVVLPLIGLPLLILVAYRLYGLLSARYIIDRDGLKVRWGLAYDDIPVDQLIRVDRALDMGLNELPSPGFWWPGLVIGHKNIEGLGRVEYFTARGPSGIVVVQSGDRCLAISPPDVEGFLRAVTEALRMGALETHEATQIRPNFALARLWADRAALILVILGALLPIALFGYLLVAIGGITSEVAFGFDATGTVDTFAPPGRLLLLPMIGGASWLVNLSFGLWMYRTRTNRPLAYTLWAGAILIAGLLWGAVLQLLDMI